MTSKTKLDHTSAMALYRKQLGDMRLFHSNRRRFHDLPWSRAVMNSKYRSGTDDRLAFSRTMRRQCRDLKSWAATAPIFDHIQDAREYAGATLLVQHLVNTMQVDEERDGYLFEYDTVQVHHHTTMAERRLANSYELLEAWQRGENTMLLKLTQEAA